MASVGLYVIFAADPLSCPAIEKRGQVLKYPHKQGSHINQLNNLSGVGNLREDA
jgi:hypothetical protein